MLWVKILESGKVMEFDGCDNWWTLDKYGKIIGIKNKTGSRFVLNRIIDGKYELLFKKPEFEMEKEEHCLWAKSKDEIIRRVGNDDHWYSVNKYGEPIFSGGTEWSDSYVLNGIINGNIKFIDKPEFKDKNQDFWPKYYGWTNDSFFRMKEEGGMLIFWSKTNNVISPELGVDYNKYSDREQYKKAPLPKEKCEALEAILFKTEEQKNKEIEAIIANYKQHGK